MSKILLIDDDVFFNKATRELMEYAGYEVVSAFDGIEGERLLREEKPDLAITDIIMPDGDGLSFIMNIGEKGILPCKVIAMSGGGRVGSTAYLEWAMKLGADDVLEKPFGMGDLLSCIKSQIA